MNSMFNALGEAQDIGCEKKVQDCKSERFSQGVEIKTKHYYYKQYTKT